MVTFQEAYRDSINKLKHASIENAELDARILLLEASGISLEYFHLNQFLEIDEDKLILLNKYIEKRLENQPVAKIIGKKHFWQDEFKVNNFTLDPRPDSEIIIESALKLLEDKSKKYKILDLGTGSGCLILSLLKELQNSIGLAVDISKDALEVAKLNAQKLELEKRSSFIESNWFENVKGEFDLIVSNPPYIPRLDIENLSSEVKKYDPYLALHGGEDGLDPYKILAKNLNKFLTKDAYAILEFGDGQAQDIKNIFIDYDIISFEKDLANKQRVVILRRKL